MSRLLAALHGKNTQRPPVWLMRQAGRYLPSYSKIRKNRSLIDMFHCSATICEVTKLPFELFDLDAAIVFSDILLVLDSLNIKWNFEEGSGPIIDSQTAIPELIQDFPYTPLVEAILQLKKELKVPLLGFAGAPFTIASYIIEGKSSKDLQKTKQMLYSNPSHFEALLDRITDAIIVLLRLQIKAGVDAIQIFDSWAMHLSLDSFRAFSLRYMKKILAALPPIPTILFCRGSSIFATELAQLKPHCISLDWTLPIGETRSKIPSSIALQGNLDPCVLFASREAVKKETTNILDAMKRDPGYIFNLGHGILPGTPIENVHTLIDTIKNAS